MHLQIRLWSPVVGEGEKTTLKGSDFKCDPLQPKGTLRDGMFVSSNRYQRQAECFLSEGLQAGWYLYDVLSLVQSVTCLADLIIGVYGKH